MLRPAKLFQNVHQLRFFVQRKLAELMVQHPPPLSLANALPPLRPPPPATSLPTPLVHGFQQQFALISKACTPYVRATQPAWRPGMRPFVYPTGTPLRIGAYRSYATGPTSISSTCMHQQGSVFNHLSYGMFSSVHAKQPVFPVADNQPKKSLAVPSHQVSTNNDDNKKATRLGRPACPMSPQPLSSSSLSDIQTSDDTSFIHHTTVATTMTRFFVTVDFFPMELEPEVFANSSQNNASIPWTRHVWMLLMTWKKNQDLFHKDLMHILQRCLDQGYEIQWMPRAGADHLATLDSPSPPPGAPRLRLYLPNRITQREQALAQLASVQAFMSGPVRWQLEEEQVPVQEPLLPLGPDYFQGVHLFLDHIDDLIHHGPAFARPSS
ncbi:hypothetical protein DM01DRAFT_1339937 [Hesseltinella vesiculosa]|uniref:Uncharacterized protein n=1 Tax=Hesseltinella vesiculosa TaxID=101127 RepID=A0A1X2G5P8_9FUNG|nr:hypothetical protein DM01DRAFT_1339937 [Hesseltinella vesiculosa]